MFVVRKSSERGYRDHSWLQTYHTFSFADYDDLAWRYFGALRVLNEDIVKPGKGFGMHPHRDMEILTYVISGTLEHKDSMGNGKQIKPREMQYMSAGTGVLHSEFNPSLQEPVHLLQIWLFPSLKGGLPRYNQITLQEEKGLHLIAGPEGSTPQELISLQAQAWVYEGCLPAQEDILYKTKGTHQWLHLIEGMVKIKDSLMGPGDSCGIKDESKIKLTTLEESTFLLFDMQAD